MEEDKGKNRDKDKDKDKERYKPTIPIIRPTHKPPPIPKDFGEYQIIEEVGSGGMGWVFKAVHKKLDVIHALKILHPALSRHEEFVANFKREAQLAAKLQHTSIVIIHNTGEFAGFHYIAMEYIDGFNLAKRLPDKGIPSLAVLAIAVKILDALDHAHNYEFSYQGRVYYGLIHRDIKPENILVDNTGEVKITDFGIARGIHLYGDVTTEGTIVGTPSYMSPEQIDGSEKITHTTDIYSLGVVMYELLSCEKAFSGTTTQIIKSISNHEYEDLGRIKREIPGEVIQIVDKAMSFKPEDRFQSAFEMRVSANRYLSQYQRDDSTTIIKNYFVYKKTLEPPRKRKKKKPSKLFAGIAKFLGIIALLFIIIWGLIYLNKIRIKNNAESALTALEEKLVSSQENYAALTFDVPLEFYTSAKEKFLLEDFKGTKTLCDSGATILQRIIQEAIETRKERITKKIDIARGCGSSVEFSTNYLIPAQGFIEAGEFDNADSLLNEALAMASREIESLCPRAPPPPPDKQRAKKRLVEVRESLADAIKDEPKIDFTPEERLIAQAQELFDQELYSKSIMKSDQADKSIAEKMIPRPECPRVEDAREHYQMLSSEQRDLLEQDWKRMDELARAGKCEAADVFAKNILEEKLPPEPTKELPDSELVTLGLKYQNRGDLESALKYYGKVRPGENKAESWRYYLPARFRMGTIHQDQKQYEKAISEYKKVLNLKNPNYRIPCYVNTGVCFFEVSEYDSAIAYFEKVEIYKDFIVPDPNKGEKIFKDTEYWHDTIYHWALALTRKFYIEKDPEEKSKLLYKAIAKWELDYLEHFRKDKDHPRRKLYLKNAETYLDNLKREG